MHSRTSFTSYPSDLSLSPGDFFWEIYSSWRFYILAAMGRKPQTPDIYSDKPDFGTAFGIDGYTKPGRGAYSEGESYVANAPARPGARMSYDEDIRLAPYSYDRDAIGKRGRASPLSETSEGR